MKLPIYILAAVWLAYTPIIHAQSARPGAAARPDGVLEQIRKREPDYADPATRRLEILTEIWGNVGLYYPVPSAMHLKWDDVLIEALRSMPQVRSDRDLVDLLNRVVFSPLNDPLVYATIRSTNSPPLVVPPIEGRWLDSTTAYIRAADKLGTMPFAKRVRAVFDSLMETRRPHDSSSIYARPSRVPTSSPRRGSVCGRASPSRADPISASCERRSSRSAREPGS